MKKILPLENAAANKLIEKIQNGLREEGLEYGDLVSDLQELRPYAIEEKDPMVTRVIRTSWEHLNEFEGWFISLPEEEEDEDEPLILEEGMDEETNSFYYMISLLLNTKNERNRVEIKHYRDQLKDYWEENA